MADFIVDGFPWKGAVHYFFVPPCGRWNLEIRRSTLWKVESGNPAVAMGIYAAVLHALNNMDKDLLLVAKDDVMGKKMQDLELLTRKHASGKRAGGRNHVC